MNPMETLSFFTSIVVVIIIGLLVQTFLPTWLFYASGIFAGALAQWVYDEMNYYQNKY